MTHESRDYEVINTLQESERFLVQKVAVDGITAVLKLAKTPEMVINLEHELRAYQMYGEMTQEADCPFEIAKVLDAGTDWTLLSFLEGTPMNEAMSPDSGQASYGQLAKIMAFCDNRIAVNYNGSSMLLPGEVHRTDLGKVKEAHSNFELLKSTEGEILKDGLEKATDFYVAQSPNLSTCFVNPDLTPSHVMVDGDSLALFDFELARLLGVRFSDLINLTTRIWFVEGDGEKAMRFYDSFWDAKGESPNPYALQLQTIVFRRCLGFTNELLTEPNQDHNTSSTMNSEFAKNIAEVLKWGNQFGSC